MKALFGADGASVLHILQTAGTDMMTSSWWSVQEFLT
jgi:hypothetical protein